MDDEYSYNICSEYSLDLQYSINAKCFEKTEVNELNCTFDRINELKAELNDLIAMNDYELSSMGIIKLSEELDELIVRYQLLKVSCS